MNKFLFGLLKIVGVLVASVVLLCFVLGPNRDEQSARTEASMLIKKVGGVNQVCKEANEIFARFGTTKDKRISTLELKDYPAISRLGEVDGIYSDYPSYLKVRVGTHVDGYILKFFDTNGTTPFVATTNCIENSQISVNR